MVMCFIAGMKAGRKQAHSCYLKSHHPIPLWWLDPQGLHGMNAFIKYIASQSKKLNECKGEREGGRNGQRGRNGRRKGEREKEREGKIVKHPSNCV